MFKESIKSYFKNLKHVYSAMAFTYLGGLILVVIVLTTAYNSMANFVNELGKIISKYGENISVNLSDAINRFSETNIQDIEGLQIALKEFIDSLGISSSDAINEAVNAASIVAVSVVTSLIVGTIIFGILVIVGSFVCGRQIRKDNDLKFKFRDLLLKGILKPFLFVILLAFSVNIVMEKQWTLAIALPVFILLEALAMLLFALWSQKGASKIIKFKDFLNFVLLTIIAYVIFAGVFVLVWLISKSPIVALIFVLPMLIFSSKFLDAYSEIHVRNKMTLINENNKDENI